MSKHIRFEDEDEDDDNEDNEMANRNDDLEDQEDESSLSSSYSSRTTYKLTVNIILKKDVKRREQSFGFQLKG